MSGKEPELEVPEALLERLPDELREGIPRDWASALSERRAAAVTWRWAKNRTGDEDLSPLARERMGYRPGRLRKPPIPEGTELTVYGYDARGRTVVAIDRSGSGQDWQERLLWHGDEEFIALDASSAQPIWPPRLGALWRARLESGRPTMIEHFGEGGASVERLRWSDDQLVESRVEQRWDLPTEYRDVFAWHGSKLVSIERHWASSGLEVVYERPWTRADLDLALSRLEDELADRIAVAVSTLDFRKPVCAMALAYSLGETSLPPGVILCPEEVRSRLVEGDDADFWYRWQAAEWMSEAEVPQLDGYGGDAFVEHCRRVHRQVTLDGDDRLIARLLQATARRLNAFDWGGTLVRTDDFMVYPWEVEGESLEEDLAASRPGGAEAST